MGGPGSGGLGPAELGFQRLLLTDWRQFGHVDLSFHRQMTILTGANGSGKTTILNLLSRHFGWTLQFVELSGLARSLSEQLPEALSTTDDEEAAELLRELYDQLDRQQRRTGPGWTERPIGRLTYESGTEAVITLQNPPRGSRTSSSQVNLYQQKIVQGLNIPAHRVVGGYQQVAWIPTKFNPTEQILESFVSELRNRFVGASPAQGQPLRSPLYWMKEALLAAAIYGEGNRHVEPDPIAYQVFQGFQEILRQILPASLGFKELRVRAAEIAVSTDTGDFAIDAISGGISAIMELAWQIFLRARVVDRFVVCIDEPENHLHPELQRILLPRLLRVYPDVQFIVSTHSPFIVSSVADSNVYVLKFDDRGKAQSIPLDTVNRAGSATQILRDVLGLPTTLPWWAEERLDAIIEKHSTSPITSESLQDMRRELKELGLDETTPEAVGEVFSRTSSANDSADQDS